MTNKREEQLLLSEHFLDKIAEAIARGIEKFEEAGVQAIGGENMLAR